MPYISGIKFITSDNPLSDTDPNIIPQDFNAGSGGKFIHAVKQWSNNPDDAVTGLAFVQGDQAPPAGFTKIHQDLNEGAGGCYNYLCIRRGGGGQRFTDISATAFDSGYSGTSYGAWKMLPQDLNTGTDQTGKFVYMLYKTA